MTTKKNKVIAIIGGAGLLGRSFVKFCNQENHHVVIMDYCEESELGNNVKNYDMFLNVDICSSESLINSLKKFTKEFKKIDCVINASYPKTKNYGKSFLDVNLNDFIENLSLHTGGYFNVMQKFGAFFVEQGYGNIINIASIQGVMAPKFSHYSGTKMTSPIEYTASKSGIIAMTRYVAKSFKGKNIRINCISPGGIRDKQPEKFIKNYKSSCLSKGMLDPDDLMGAIKFLISDESRYFNGQNLIVDDGWSL